MTSLVKLALGSVALLSCASGPTFTKIDRDRYSITCEYESDCRHAAEQACPYGYDPKHRPGSTDDTQMSPDEHGEVQVRCWAKIECNKQGCPAPYKRCRASDDEPGKSYCGP
ncbi:MAG TPA: hypothetical protein VGP93_20845 [Polyangiaceae bacterium]|nr:hypothetical protein [Polyangiaceae bacterium]